MILNKLHTLKLFGKRGGILSLLFVLSFLLPSCISEDETYSLKNLQILCNDLIKVQDLNTDSENFGALYCSECKDYHTRAGESVLPFAVSYKETGEKKYLTPVITVGDWLVRTMSHEFTSINYCATCTATLMACNQVVPDPSYLVTPLPDFEETD